MISQLKMGKWFIASKMRFSTLTMPVGFLAAMVLTGCHHSANGPNDNASSGVTVKYLLNSSASSSATPKDPIPSEKLAAQFFSNISAGDLAAAKAEVDGVQGDPIRRIATEVKAHGPITDVTFTSWDPRGDSLRLDGVLIHSDKKGVLFEVVEEAPTSDYRDPQKKQDDYTKGKWTVAAVF